MQLTTARVAVLLAAGLAPSTAMAQVTIDNDRPAGTFGSFSVEVGGAGDSRTANLTARRASNNELVTDDLLFDYLTYIEAANGEVDLLADSTLTGPTLTGDDQVTSTGLFTNGNGTAVSWTAVTTLANDSTLLQTVFTFDGNGLPLGDLRLIDYVDQDVLENDDDVLFTTGSAASANLQVFTVDDAEVIGVSQSGSFTAAQGLSNAIFAGFAGDQFSDLEDEIQDGTAVFSLGGNIDTGDLPLVSRPNLPGGIAYGPEDVTSALAWDIDPTATTAQIIVTLGGIPDATAIPEPAGLAGLAALGALGLVRRRR